MDHTLLFEVPAEQFYREFTSREYWQTLMENYRQWDPSSQITHFASASDGTTVVFKQNVARDALPPLIKRILPLDMTITREQRFGPFDPETGRAEGSYRATVPGSPGKFSGRYYLSPSDSGSQLVLSSECRVSVPLVGGKIEGLIMHHIQEIFDNEEAFTAEWIAERH